MHKLKRKEILLQKIVEKNFMSSKDFLEYAQSNGINESTARRDLKELEKEDKITLTFGGIISKVENELEIGRIEKAQKELYKKVAIANEAIKLLKENDVIFCAPGTTIEHFVKKIDKKIKVLVTNSFPVFLSAWNNKNIKDVFLLGGIFKEKSQVFYNRDTKKYLEGIKFSNAFFSCYSIDYEGNIYDDFAPELDVLIEVLKRSTVKNLLVDSSKFVNEGINQLISVNDINNLITDQKAKGLITEKIEYLNIVFSKEN
ncbi:DeoR/GlpR family DNA-binding transcription regulator [Spiroplasma taiwanense]|uniref:Lactose phosphotransferase system repressor n=1 Tax=Spiroplasma taiwanense CT-1 TaxID=1276220 RepID=S5MHM6_9MOLU|nr:DeoR/GlpR family DNA-binding transcription regulator [Spiroplasma taiwanense]AGR41365.1 lactose phosphotransferase system repressor [Spiroplasma taiwanense CT-1]